MMGSRFRLAGFVGIALLLVLTAGTAYAQNTLRGDDGEKIGLGPVSIGATTEVLGQGDFGPEFGIGCSNGAGTSGGPNDLALGVTASVLAPPFNLTSFSYNMFTNVSPTMTNLSMKLWNGGGTPGGTFASVAGLPFTQGNHTEAINVGVSQTQFFLGVFNGQTNAGFRIGVDSSSGSAGTSFLRTPACGNSAFLSLDQIGFAGNWVMRAIANGVIPVELETFEIE